MELITENCIPHIKTPALSPEELALPYAKFYTSYPLYPPDPLRQQILNAGPMHVEDAIPIEHWLDWVDPKKNPRVVYGYTMMPDGSGFYIEYSTTPPTWNGAWRRWYGKWYNQHPKELPDGRGNLRYKLWNPVDHWDHRFINGKDDRDGVWSVETLDIGASGDPSRGLPAVSHNIDLLEYGLSPERKAALEAADCRVEGCWEEFFQPQQPGQEPVRAPGHHLVLRVSRPCPLGGRENIQCEWMGYWARDGKIVRDEEAPVEETYVKNVIIHNTIERAHLLQVLPDLYKELHDQPLGEV